MITDNLDSTRSDAESPSQPQGDSTDLDEILDRYLIESRDAHESQGGDGDIEAQRQANVKARAALTRWKDREAAKLVLSIEEELLTFTAAHDQPMRDEAIEIVRAKAHQLTKGGTDE